MKRSFIISCLVLLSCTQQIQVVLDDQLYVKIAAEAVCSNDVDDTPIYTKYGVTKEQIMNYKATIEKNSERQKKIGAAILETSSQCL